MVKRTDPNEQSSARRGAWSAVDRIKFCPCCGGAELDHVAYGSDGTCVCLSCRTVFSVLAVAVQESPERPDDPKDEGFA